jgi:hypothetical protein
MDKQNKMSAQLTHFFFSSFLSRSFIGRTRTATTILSVPESFLFLRADMVAFKSMLPTPSLTSLTTEGRLGCAFNMYYCGTDGCVRLSVSPTRHARAHTTSHTPQIRPHAVICHTPEVLGVKGQAKCLPLTHTHHRLPKVRGCPTLPKLRLSLVAVCDCTPKPRFINRKTTVHDIRTGGARLRVTQSRDRETTH